MKFFDPPWEKSVYPDKEPQTGKKTVIDADLKPGMYIRFRGESGVFGLRQIFKSPETGYLLYNTAGRWANSFNTLADLADAINGRVAMYELLDEQPVLSFSPKRCTPDPIPEPTPAPRAPGFDPYSVFAATYGKQKLQFVEAEPDPTVIELDLADGTNIVITTPGK